jgi:hypothetical protein
VAHRFTNTNKWDDDWYLELPLKFKVAWSYLCDTCDGGTGFKKISFLKLSRDVGESITREEFDHHFGDRVHWVNEETIWIHGYIKEQFRKLAVKNKAHVNMIKNLISLLEGQSFSKKAQKSFDDLLKFLNEYEVYLLTLAGESSDPLPTLGVGPGGLNRKQETGNRKQETGKEEGGSGEKISPAAILACCKTWKETLKHRAVDRSLFLFEQMEIGRQIKSLGAEAVDRMLYGFRFESSFEGYDAKSHISLNRVFDEEQRDKWINLASQNQTPTREVYEPVIEC